MSDRLYMRRHLLCLVLMGSPIWAQSANTPEAPLNLGPGTGVQAPSPINRVYPAYSEEAFVAKVQGTVVVGLVVQKDGRPTNIRALRPLGFGLDEKAIESVAQWRFKPGTKEGQPVSVNATIELTFRLPQWRTESFSALSRDVAMRPSIVKNEFPPSPAGPQKVFVSFLMDVSDQGVPENIHVEKSSDKQWENAALLAVSQWRFSPALRDNQPVRASCSLTIAYTN